MDEESAKTSVDHITIFAKSKSQRVDFPGLSNECFSEMTEQMILALNKVSPMVAVGQITKSKIMKCG